MAGPVLRKFNTGVPQLKLVDFVTELKEYN